MQKHCYESGSCAQIICAIRGSPQSPGNILGQLPPRTSYKQVLRHNKRLDESTSCNIFTRFWIWLSRFESYSPSQPPASRLSRKLGGSSPGGSGISAKKRATIPIAATAEFTSNASL